jgi:diaminopimelate epimerase
VRLDGGALDAEGRAVHPELGPIAFVPVSVGNPHAVVFVEAEGDGDGSADARGSEGARPRRISIDQVGPFLATHPAFPEGTNVPLVPAAGGGRVRIDIWERGVGRTSASGTSSCAAAAAAVATRRVSAGPVAVSMAGGELSVVVGPALEITLRGPVQAVERGRLVPGFVDGL